MIETDDAAEEAASRMYHPDGRLAQLVRAPRLHRGGRGFESLTAHSYTCRNLHLFGQRQVEPMSQRIAGRVDPHKLRPLRSRGPRSVTAASIGPPDHIKRAADDWTGWRRRAEGQTGGAECGTLAAGLGVCRIYRLGLRRPLLPKEDRQHHECPN
jgi:hypothetical protein